MARGTVPAGATMMHPIMSALRLGASLRTRLDTAPPVAGRLHSVFARAFNVEWHDGGLVTFQGPGALVAPFAAALPAMPPATTLPPGLTAWRDPDGLRVGQTQIRWNEAETVDLALDPAPGPPRAVVVATREAARDGAGAALSSGAGRRGRSALARGIRSADADAFVEGGQALIGLGEGLTPAGDDCLVGALAVLRRFGRGRLHALAEARDAIVEAAEQRTTTVGRAFLIDALGGEFSELVADLLRAQSLPEATTAAARLLATGASSGADTLGGMRLAFEALGFPEA